MNNMLEAEILGEVHKVPVDIGGDLSQDGVLHYRAEDGEVLNVPVDTELDSGSSNLVTNGAVAGAINGLEESKQNKITSDNKLNADLVDDLSATHKFVSAEEKQQIQTNATNISNIQLVIPVEATSNNKLADKNSAVGSIVMSLNSETYVLTLQAKNVNGQNIGNAQSIDLPIESVIVSGSYDSVNKQIILVLQNGNTIEIPVGDLISGLQPEITQNNKLSSDLVDDTNQTNKFVTQQEKTKLSGIESGAQVNTITGIKGNAETNYRTGNVELTPDNLDDTNTTNKFVTSAEKTQIATNTSNISAIKDGTNIDSFGDVETALAGKQDNLTTSSVNDGTIDKSIGFDNQGNLVKGQVSAGQTIQYATMPTASAENAGKIVEYVGTTNANYTNGYFYECVENTIHSVVDENQNQYYCGELPALSEEVQLYSDNTLETEVVGYKLRHTSSGYKIVINSDVDWGNLTITEVSSYSWLQKNVQPESQNLQPFTTAEMETICDDILYPALPAPTDVTADDTEIEFDGVEGAEQYEIYADGDSIGSFNAWAGTDLLNTSWELDTDITGYSVVSTIVNNMVSGTALDINDNTYSFTPSDNLNLKVYQNVNDNTDLKGIIALTPNGTADEYVIKAMEITGGTTTDNTLIQFLKDYGIYLVDGIDFPTPPPEPTPEPTPEDVPPDDTLPDDTPPDDIPPDDIPPQF